MYRYLKGLLAGKELEEHVTLFKSHRQVDINSIFFIYNSGPHHKRIASR